MRMLNLLTAQLQAAARRQPDVHAGGGGRVAAAGARHALPRRGPRPAVRPAARAPAVRCGRLRRRPCHGGTRSAYTAHKRNPCRAHHHTLTLSRHLPSAFLRALLADPLVSSRHGCATVGGHSAAAGGECTARGMGRVPECAGAMVWRRAPGLAGEQMPCICGQVITCGFKRIWPAEFDAS